MSFAYTPIFITATQSAGGASSVGGGLITVGTSGIYPTVAAAIAASHNVLFVNSPATEQGDITVPSSGLNITILPFGRVDMGANRFLLDSRKLNIDGQGTVQFAHVAPSILFDGNIGSALNVNGVRIDNNSQIPTYMTDVNGAKFNSVVFEGDLHILSNDNIYNGCKYVNGNLTVAAGVTNTMIGNSIFDGMLIIDSGNGTMISDGAVV